MATTTQSSSAALATDGAGCSSHVGEAVRLLYRLGRQYAAGIRAVSMPITAMIGLLAAPVNAIWITAGVVATVMGWSVVYVRALLRGPARWYTIVDAGVLVLFCISTRWIVPTDWLVGGESWVMTFVSFACVAHQCHSGLMLGLSTSLGVMTALVVGSVGATPAALAANIAISSSWAMVAVLLARLLWILLRRGGRLAD